MTQSLSLRYREFAERKIREAEAAPIHRLVTLEDRTAGRGLVGMGNAWTRDFYDGDFYLFAPPPELPAVSLVFVQSREGNTGADNPEDLGGGPTDKHLIYEGLSRVAADAVLAGAATATGTDVFFSVWHPEVVALRRDLGLPRHPVQVVVSKDGRVDFDALLFNVPDVPVIVLAGTVCRDRCQREFTVRPWIKIVDLQPDGIATGLLKLRQEFQIRRISAIGGRTVASRLLDAGLVQDLCLTTSSRSAGEPNTPFYLGKQAVSLDPIASKRGTDPAAPIRFEHVAVG